jgi:hypothetical protein
MPANSSDPRSSWLSNIELTAIAIAISTGLLYLMGEAMHRGFLRGFGLGYEIMPISTTEAIARGVRVFFSDIFLIIILGGFFLFLAALLLYPLALGIAAGAKLAADWLRNKVWFDRALGRRMNSWAVTIGASLAHDSQFRVTSTYVVRVIFAVLLFFVFLVIPFYIGSHSFERGERLAADMQEHCHPNSQSYQIYGFLTSWVDIELAAGQNSEATILSGCIIFASERYTAIYTPVGEIKTRALATELVREIRPVPLGGWVQR